MPLYGPEATLTWDIDINNLVVSHTKHTACIG